MMSIQARLIRIVAVIIGVFLGGAAMLGVGVLQHITIADLVFGAMMCGIGYWWGLSEVMSVKDLER